MCVCVHNCTYMYITRTVWKGLFVWFFHVSWLVGIPGSLGAIMPERMYLQAAPKVLAPKC